MAQRFGTFILALWLLAMLAACGSAVPSGQPPPMPSGVVVTLRVADAEEYRIRLTNPDDIAIAQKLLAGAAVPRIPNGRVVRGDPDVNVGYSWQIDPASVEFADTTTEVCDGRPSDVEKGTITTITFVQLNDLRLGVGADWPFLYDEQRVIQQDLDIQEYTDPHNNPMIPHTFVLEPGLKIYKIYNGYWYWWAADDE